MDRKKLIDHAYNAGVRAAGTTFEIDVGIRFELFEIGKLLNMEKEIEEAYNRGKADGSR